MSSFRRNMIMSYAARNRGSVVKRRGIFNAQRQAIVSRLRATVPRPLALGHSETKYADISITGGAGVALVTAGAATVANLNGSTGFIPLNWLQQGALATQRDGNICTIKGVNVCMELLMSAFAFANDAHVRWALVQYMVPGGANFPLSSIFSDQDTAGGAATTSFHSGINMSNTMNVKVLRAGVILLNQGQGETALVKCYTRCNLRTVFNGTANPMTAVQIQQGGLYFVFFYNGGGGAPVFQMFKSRVTYTDH